MKHLSEEFKRQGNDNLFYRSKSMIHTPNNI